MAQPDRDEPDVAPVRAGLARRAAALDDAEERLRWYATYGHRALWSYRILALGQLIAAALVPVLVAAGVAAWVSAVCGGIAAILTGAQQVLQVGPDSLRLGAARVAVDGSCGSTARRPARTPGWPRASNCWPS